MDIKCSECGIDLSDANRHQYISLMNLASMKIIRHECSRCYKETNCQCGIDRDGNWSESVFNRFGCDCD